MTLSLCKFLKKQNILLAKYIKVIFKYRQINLPSPFSHRKYLLRPIISLGLSYKKSSIRYEALIDSGADFSIFPIEIAQKLGILLKKERIVFVFLVWGMSL